MKRIEIKDAQLFDGRLVKDLTPQYDGDLAVVSIDVITRLSRSLKHVPFDRVKQDMIDHIRVSSDLEGMCELLESEIAFHRTVNLLELIDRERIAEPQSHE